MITFERLPIPASLGSPDIRRERDISLRDPLLLKAEDRQRKILKNRTRTLLCNLMSRKLHSAYDAIADIFGERSGCAHAYSEENEGEDLVSEAVRYGLVGPILSEQDAYEQMVYAYEATNIAPFDGIRNKSCIALSYLHPPPMWWQALRCKANPYLVWQDLKSLNELFAQKGRSTITHIWVDQVFIQRKPNADWIKEGLRPYHELRVLRTRMVPLEDNFRGPVHGPPSLWENSIAILQQHYASQEHCGNKLLNLYSRDDESRMGQIDNAIRRTIQTVANELIEHDVGTYFNEHLDSRLWLRAEALMASFGKGMVATPQLLVLHKWIDEISFPSEDQLHSDAMKFFEESNGTLDRSAREQLKTLTEDLVERLYQISVNSTARHRSRGVLTYTDPGEAGAFRLSYENALIELLRKHAFGSFRDLECYSSEDKRLLNLAWIESAMGPDAIVTLSIGQRVVKAFRASQKKRIRMRMREDAAECYGEDQLENHFGKQHLVSSLESMSQECQSCSSGWQGDIEKVGGSLGTLAFAMDRQSMEQASEVLNSNRKANIQWHELWRGGWYSDVLEQAASSTIHTNLGTTRQKSGVSMLVGLECVSKEEGTWCHLVRIHNADRTTVRVDRKLTLFVCDYKLWKLLKSLLNKENRFAALEIISWLTDLNSRDDNHLFDLLGIHIKGLPAKRDSTTPRPLDEKAMIHSGESNTLASMWPIV